MGEEVDNSILKYMKEGNMFKFELGAEVKDTITRFQGVITGRTEWLYGCRRYGLTSRKLRDNKPIEAQWFDEPQLVEVKVSKTQKVKKPTFGPKPDPSRPHG